MARQRAKADETFVGIAFNGTWRIEAKDGEYLDVVEQGGQLRFTTNPVSRLRHEFRLQSFEQLDGDRWAVWAEPVRLLSEVDVVESRRAPGGHVFPFVLAYDGCDRFVLEALPDAHALRTASSVSTLEGVRAVSDFFVEEAAGLPVAMDAFTFLNTVSGINFPVFAGDERRAFNSIAAQLGLDPHSSLLTLAALSNVRKPDDIPQAAWDAVITQLRKEIDFRQLCNGYFGQVESFVQNVFISNAGLVDNVGAIVGLDKSNVVQLLLNSAMQAAAGAVGGLSFPGAGVVSGALKVLFQQLAADKGPNAGNFNVALSEARTKVSELFDSLITAIQNWRIDVFSDWGKLQTMGQNIKSGQVAWPANDEEMRKAAKTSLEISLYKDLVKVRWNHMRASNDPTFSTRGDWSSYMDKNKNYWVETRPHTKKDIFGKETKGFMVTMHWLGRGSTIFDHKEPDDRLPIRVFNELKVPRSTVFNEWGLAPQTFYVQSGGGIRI